MGFEPTTLSLGREGTPPKQSIFSVLFKLQIIFRITFRITFFQLTFSHECFALPKIITISGDLQEKNQLINLVGIKTGPLFYQIFPHLQITLQRIPHNHNYLVGVAVFIIDKPLVLDSA